MKLAERLFLILLPIWGFFFGFALGAQTLQALFGQGFLATTSSWVVGFFIGAIFGLLSYLFYLFGVGILAGSLGCALGAGFMNLIGIDRGLLVWIVGIVAAVVAIAVTFYFKWLFLTFLFVAVYYAGLFRLYTQRRRETMPHQYIIIVGCGRLGARLANQLSSQGHSVVVVDHDESSFANLSTEFSGFQVTGDAAELAVLRRARIEQADCLLAITRQDNVNLMKETTNDRSRVRSKTSLSW